MVAHWANDSRVFIFNLLDDIGQPYSCNFWGFSGTTGVPVIIDDGAGHTFHDLFELVLDAYPVNVFLDHEMNVVNITEAEMNQTAVNNVIQEMVDNIPEYSDCIGDVNEDEVLDVLDVVLGINIILEIDNPTEAQLWALDFNEDGDTNILDLVIMVNAILDGDWECEEVDICDGLTEVELWGEWYDIESSTEINLTNQGLTGSIPPEIGCLINLTSLYLQNNQLTGEIPSEIGNLENLLGFSLSYNQLTGEIPLEIGNLTNLTYFHLHFNQLIGEIPQEVCDLMQSNSLAMWGVLDGNSLINACE